MVVTFVGWNFPPDYPSTPLLFSRTLKRWTPRYLVMYVSKFNSTYVYIYIYSIYYIQIFIISICIGIHFYYINLHRHTVIRTSKRMKKEQSRMWPCKLGLASLLPILEICHAGYRATNCSTWNHKNRGTSAWNCTWR